MFINQFIFRSLAVFLLLSYSLNVQSQELERLVESQPSQALKRLDALLKENTKNAQALFLKGVALENLGDTSRAIIVYKNAIAQFPKQPEAYLNLANIYNNQGDYKQAKQLLEKSFTQHPVYSKAYYGMQKIHSHMAAKAYQEALNKEVTINSPKLSRVTEFTSLENESVTIPVKPKPIPDSTITPEQSVAVVVEPDPVKPVAVKPVVIKPKPINTEKDLSSNVKAWAKAWSAQDVVKFVSYYSKNYTVSGKTRSQWIADRRIKLTNKKFIKVNVGSFQQKKLNENLTQVDFVQSYRSNTIADTIRKRLVFQQFGNEWKIIRESVVR